MDPFSAAVLAQLTADLTEGVVRSLGGALKRQLSGTPEQQALERSIRAGIVALVAQATAATATPEEEDLLADIFEKFFHHPVVWVAVGQLIGGTPLDHAQLRGLFTDPDDPDTGYDLERLQSVDFDAALDAFTAAFVESVRRQKDLAHVVQSGLLSQLVRGQGESTQQIRELVARIDQLAAVAVRGGNVLDGASGNIGRDKIDNAENVLSGDFRRATIHIVNQYMNTPGDPLWSEEDFSAALRRYLDWAAKRYGRPQLRGIEKRERELPDITLDKVYVSLAAVPDPVAHEGKPARRGHETVPEETLLGEGRQPEPVDMAGLLKENSRLVITGAPGSGKTTYLYIIASTLAQAMVTGDVGSVQKELGLAAPLPLPIYISLGDYNRYRLASREPGDPEHGTLLAYARYALIRQLGGLNLPKDFFERLLTQGQTCVFLLDGLDEVVDERHRKTVSQEVEDLSYIDDLGYIVVTSRTRAYVGESKLPPTFRRAEVQPMTPQQVDELAERWCHAVYDPVDAPNEAAELQAEIAHLEEHRRARGEERRFADTPLLVTIIAIVHYNDRHLPEQRAALYKSCVHVLLAESHHTKGEARHDLEDWGGTEDDKRELLTLLAYNMMAAGKDAGRTVEESVLKKWLRSRVAARHGQSAADQMLADFLQAMAERASLLHERDRIYEFIHLSFQEYLCATYLAHEMPDLSAIASFLVDGGHVTDSWWRETILLTPGYLSIDNRTAALGLIQRLTDLPRRDSLALAAAELAGSAYLELNFSDQDTCDRVAKRLVDLLTDEYLAAPNPLRGLAGAALGRLGDPREGVDCEIPDTVLIPAGPFRMGSDKQGRKNLWYDEMAFEREGPSHEIDWLDFDYCIGKYPVTVAQYRYFVEAGGYDPRKSAQYWQGGGLKWLRESGRKAPRYWDDPQWTVGNHPVVGVTWYEAVAYCNWLNATKPADRGVFRLPDEAMWEKAARGTDGRRWPWGNEWDATKLNSREGGINRTSAVGIFPAGRRWINEGRKSEAAEFIYDCAGNVWEWCSGPGVGDAPYPFKRRSYKEDLELAPTFRALRGGSWNYYGRVTRAAFRDNDDPDDWDLNLGFRVVELLSDSDS